MSVCSAQGNAILLPELGTRPPSKQAFHTQVLHATLSKHHEEKQTSGKYAKLERLP